MTSKPVIIFGTSDMGRMVDFYLTNDSDHQVAVYAASQHWLDTNNVSEFNGRPIVSFENVTTAYPPQDFAMFVAMGYADMNAMRQDFVTSAETKGYTLISHICSNTSRWKDLRIGKNVFVFDDNCLQPNVAIGNGVILSRGNSIGHDSVIHDHVFIANHAVLCGHNVVGERCFIGSNATIMDGVELAERTLVGAHSYIKRDTAPGDAFVTEQTPKSSRGADEFFNW